MDGGRTFLVLITVLLCLISKGCGMKTFCYFTNWSHQYSSPEARFTISDINTTICSHLIYAFANIDPIKYTLVPSDNSDDTSSSGEKSGRYYDFNRLKRKAPGLVTLVAVGGATNNNNGFKSIVQTSSARTDFAKNVALFLREKEFDGIDIDWEWPGKEFRDTFTLLLKAMHDEFSAEAKRENKPRLLLTVAVGVGETTITDSYNIPELSKYVDYINVMAYDFHGPWSQVTSFSSPLYSRSSSLQFNQQLSQDWAINRWLQGSAPANKLVLGCTATATTFRLSNVANSGVGESVSGPGYPGPYIGQSGRVVYYRACDLLKEGSQERWDGEQKMNYLINGTEWVGYNGQRSIHDKVEYAYNKKLAGVMMWSLEQDDFKGTHCGAGKYPLLSTIHDTIHSLTVTTNGNTSDDTSGAQKMRSVFYTVVTITLLTIVL